MAETTVCFSNDAQLKILKCPDGIAFIEARDTLTPGLSVRITKHGTKTFFGRYRFQGKPKRERLGRRPKRGYGHRG